MLHINNLHATINNQDILKGVNLQILPGEVHAIMGPNGSGKSTLASVLAGRDDYDVAEGEIIFEGKNIVESSPEERAQAGLFLAFQYPVEIPGVSTTTFLHTAFNEIRKSKGEEPVDAMDFLAKLKEKRELLDLKEDMTTGRGLNEGFSGGEKKKNEVLQMAMLEPKMMVLDETDSGLDIDALKTVAGGVNGLRNKENAFLIITHYHRILEYIEPDHIHIFVDGQIVKSGGKELALELEKTGYDEMKKAVTA